jgi:hypothetical protein
MGYSAAGQPEMHIETPRGFLARARYRTGQVVASLRPTISDDERGLLRQTLPPEAVVLFEQMPLRDQRHSLDIWHALQQASIIQPDLLAAALLHDMGKTVYDGRPLRLWHRVAVVMLDTLRPGTVDRIASADPASWRHPFYAHLHHPEHGAQLARCAGCTALTVELIRRHQDKLARTPADETERLLALLQAADDAN